MTAAVVKAIADEVQKLTGSASFEAWSEDETLKAGDLVVLNNSFLFREGITPKTTKSDSYLALQVGDDGRQGRPIVVRPRSQIKLPFKRIAQQTASEYERRELDDAVSAQLENLGNIVFALVGAVGERELAVVPLNHVGSFEELRFDPGQDEIVQFDGLALSIRELDGVDELWWRVEELARTDDNVELDDRAPEAFDKRLAALQEEAGRPVDIGLVGDDGQTILSQVLERVDEQVEEFGVVLDAYERDPEDVEALHELLRVAYNFADGAKSLLTLVVGVSDLKPVLFWLSVFEQFQLADRFTALPFSLVGKAKPSIGRYRDVISGARNRAFHDLFAFGRPFHVRLSADALKAAELRLFREHSRRSEPALEYEDRKLVDLLEDFTRAQERPVPSGFWEQNKAVMQAVSDVGRALERGLVLCHSEVSDT